MTIFRTNTTTGLRIEPDNAGNIVFIANDIPALRMESSGVVDFSSGRLVLPTGNTASRQSSSSAATLRFNSELGKIEVYNGQNWANIATDARQFSLEYLVIAGGAGGGGGYGGYAGGGGGAGGVSSGTMPITISPSFNYICTVGAGGAGAPSTTYSVGANGSPSVFGQYLTSVTSITPPGGSSSPFSGTATAGGAGLVFGGGGGGGSGAPTANPGGLNGQPGGSGGGGGTAGNTAAVDYPGGSGTPGQGNSGGVGRSRSGLGFLGVAAGGGGGSGGAGSAGTRSPGGSGGPGGPGTNSSITGSSVTYAGGGGGAAHSSAGPQGTGGPGGGGAGGGNNATGYGSGGGGGWTPSPIAAPGGSGSGGAIILAHANTITNAIVDAGLTYTLNTESRPGFYVYTITGGTGTIYWN